ncbi:MAG: efflux RND transporter periplasmic adaptor subunit [Chitinivibrionales bacterium]|nr:efflux RND transporter periplasmic adaptor subunit [Chitinivibrionales bacterium]
MKRVRKVMKYAGMTAMLCLICSLSLQQCTRTDAGSRDQNQNKPVKTTKIAANGTTKTIDSTKVSVVVADVKSTHFEDWGTYSAGLRGIEDAYLTAPYQGGRINSVKAVGSRVRAGEALCDIDSNRYEAALQAALAQVAIARGDLDRTKVNVEKGSVGSSALGGAELAYQNGRMMLATAQRAYEDCRCQAPFSGIIVSHSIDRFQTVAPGAPTVRLSRIDQLEAVISIPETDAFSYTEGMKAEFRLIQNQQRVYRGTLMSLDRAVDPSSRTVAARFVIGNGDNSLKPGMVGKVRILRKIYAHAIVIPSTALLRLQEGTSVMVVEKGIARQQPVHVEATDADQLLISEGLKPGDTLIVTGAFQVSTGTRVVY